MDHPKNHGMSWRVVSLFFPAAEALAVGFHDAGGRDLLAGGQRRGHGGALFRPGAHAAEVLARDRAWAGAGDGAVLLLLLG